MTLSWAKATDNYVVPGTIQYKVVMSTGNNISTVSEAETADSSKTLLQDWTADISSINVSSLIAGSTYYFSVLTKDSADNKSIYATKTQATVPLVGNSTISTSNVTSTTLTLNWTKVPASIYSSPSVLQYKVMMSTTNNISTIAEAETTGGGRSIVQDWTTDIGTASVGGLTAGSTYYFNVFVKDSLGNIGTYATKTQATVPPPSNLSYSSSPIMLGAGLAIDFSILPTVTSTVRVYSVSPSLPTGLTIDATTGAITGTPTATQSATNYTVTASNGEGSSTTAIISIKVGNYGACYSWGCFKDNMNGTIAFEGTAGTFGGNTYTAQNLTFMKCSQGQTWNNGTNSCDGSAGTYQYCSVSDNRCNSDGTGNPAWTLNGTGSSSAYTTCNSIGTFAGKTGWRVPTKDELKILIHCSNKTMPNDGYSCSSYTSPTINNLFPNTIAYVYWSSTTYSTSSNYAQYVNFNTGYTNGSSKGSILYIRCVSGQ